MDRQVAQLIIIKKREVGTHHKEQVLCKCNNCGVETWYDWTSICPDKDHPYGNGGKFCSKKCYGEYQREKRNPYHWQGGIRLHSQKGYRYTMEHVGNGSYYRGLARIKMEEKLKRPLKRSEFVYHINGDNTDNRIENLFIRGSRWSVRHDACISCGKNDTKHAARGVCIRCRARERNQTPASKAYRQAYYQKKKKGLIVESHLVPWR